MTNEEVERLADKFYSEKDIDKKARIFTEIDEIVINTTDKERPGKFFILENIVMLG